MSFERLNTKENECQVRRDSDPQIDGDLEKVEELSDEEADEEFGLMKAHLLRRINEDLGY